MGLLDKVKESASQAAQKAQEAGKAGQAKIEDAQAKRKVDALFRDLGAAVYAERTGKPGADPAVADKLVAEITSIEAEHGGGAVSTEPTAEEQTF
ncbi:MAG TPA: hypothetical protein VG435_06720 [Acidimicrobiales bacterium]|jgi:hypothetical protein|nr:hypothetical protein [Acidimicrobiales bacterium]